MTGAEILSGVTLATFAGAGLFFLKFWRASRDRFFLLFSAACWLVALERFATFFISDAFDPLRPSSSPGNWVYVFRLFAFVAIIAAFIDKNRKQNSGASDR